MISNAKDRSLNDNPGTLPDLTGAIADYFRKMTATLIRKSTVNHQLVETPVQLEFMAMRQPLNAQAIAMKPEGQRSWKWEQLHAWPGLELKIDDKIQFDSLPYRVMAKLDFKEYGYVEYHICQDYKP